MCGIAGFAAVRSEAFAHASQLVEEQLKFIERRGPDSHGVWLDPEHGIALGHRRLAIVDLSAAGHQPMHSPNGRYVITYNGEIYNHLELRAELESQGSAPVWKGHSDTETLIAGFEAWGIERTLSRCVGMFAFALYDRHQRKLHLGRDRFGEKPLYYGFVGEGAARRFAFGSDIRVITSLPGFNAPLNMDAVGSLLGFGYIGAPSTIHAGVFHLPPASLLTFRSAEAGVVLSSYWDATQAACDAARHRFSGSEEDAVDALEAVLGQAVRGQMLADVPLGAFLSGGIDSTAVVAMMTRASAAQVKTFTIGFREASFNEAIYAKQVAEHLGTCHTEHYLSHQDALAIIPQLPNFYSEPFGDSSEIATILVATLARKHVKVSLSGDAGDELFGGYNRYLFADRTWGSLQNIPLPLRKGVARALSGLSRESLERLGGVYHALAGKHGQVNNFADKATKAIRVLDSKSIGDVYHGAVSFWDPSLLGQGSQRHQMPVGRDSAGLSPIELMMLMDTHNYLPGDILHKVDRACMGVSLEGRVPFLDHRVFEFAWSLPLSYKVRDGQGKRVLRKMLERYLPKHLMDRPKMGFALPLAGWLRGPLRPWAEELVSTASLSSIPGLQVQRVRSAWELHCSGQRNMTEQLWPLLMLQAWLRNR